MVKMGELSGNLDDTFASLAAHYEREEALTGSIRDALTYPLIMLGMALCGPPCADRKSHAGF